MTRNRTTQIGLDRTVRLHWLEKISNLASAKLDRESVKAILQHDLKYSFRSSRSDVRGSLDKTITILIKIWLDPPPHLASMREVGLAFLQQTSPERHIAVHWGMTMAVYPFWSNVALQVGRLLRLQGAVTAVQIQRRMCEQYGERETVARRTRYILRSYLDWGVLLETGSKGVYTSGRTLPIGDPPLIFWMVEASLHARASASAPLKDLIDSPGFFPFQIDPVRSENIQSANARLEILRHGLDDDFVILRTASD